MVTGQAIKEASLKTAQFVKGAKCKKCGGSLYLSRDCFGEYIACLQCGFTHDLDAAVPGEKMHWSSHE